MADTDNRLSQCPLDLPSATQSTRLNPVIEKYELALLMLLGFAGFSMLIGIAYNKLRRYVFRDFHSLDTVFDAGGRVSVSLTAVTVTSQLLWPADFLQSPTMASKVGVAGSLFYTLGVVLAMIVFSVLCVHLKTRAPGAKTFPQIAYARFGKGVQIMFCVVALFTNMVIMANLIFAGKATIDVLAKDTSTEFILFTLAVLFGSYCFIGGLGTTFYISYFNTALIFITTSLFILKVTYLVEPEVEEFTSIISLHNTMSCLKGPEGNYGNSFLSFRSIPGVIFGIITFLMAMSVVFCDQANWQSRIAAKPREGMTGFLISAFLWFAVPMSVSFVTSMTYKSMSFHNGTNLLTDTEIDEGKATIDVLAKDTSTEFILFTLAVLFGSYCFIGGLGTTFYISYFNTALIFITTSLFILKVTYLVEPEVEEFTSIISLHNTMSCLKGPEGNYGNSFLSFRSIPGVIFGIITFLMAMSVVFCDQANWQSRIAAKPREGMTGFLISAFLWFAVPMSVSFVTSMTYKSMSFHNGTNLLTDTEIDEGFITPFVVQTLLGKEGCFVLLTLITMTLMSGEVMAISSILVYDIFKVHIKPFRANTKPTECDLCGKSKIPVTAELVQPQLCDCPTSLECDLCGQDIKDHLAGILKPGFKYKCIVHGKLRHYEDQLLQYKSWCMVGVITAIVPFGLIIIESGMNLNWVFLASPVFICPFLMPLYFTISWDGVTSKGLLLGGIAGLVCAAVGMFTYGATYEGGLSDFYTNTTQDYSLIIGFSSGITVSTLVTVIVSLCNKASKEDVVLNDDFMSENSEDKIWTKLKREPKGLKVEWLKTMSIDNPLNTYRRIYSKELAAINAGRILTPLHMEKVFRRTRRVSYIGVFISFVVFLFVVPSVALSKEILTENQLGSWLSVCQHWCFIATIFVVLIPPVQEGLKIWRQHKKNKRFIVANNSEISLTIAQ